MLKTNVPVKILSIVPRTKYLGVALFYGTELRDWRIKVLNEKGTQGKVKKAKDIILSFIERYEPQVLALKKLDLKKSSKNLNYLVRKIKEFARRKNLFICEMKLSEVKESIFPGRRINKKELAQIVVSRYPELFFDFKKEKKNKNSYYERMFEAAALGISCFYKVDGKIKLNKNYGKK